MYYTLTPFFVHSCADITTNKQANVIKISFDILENKT